MCPQETNELRHLLVPDLEDIHQSVTMFPGGVLNLSYSGSLRLLHRFHVFNEHKLVRGLDSDSNKTFLSIWLQSVETSTDSMLLIYHFNAFDLERVKVHRSNVFLWQPWLSYWEPVPRNIQGLQQLLVNGHLEAADEGQTPATWSIEGSTMRRCRWAAHAMKYRICPVVACVAVTVLFILLVLYLS